MKVFKLISFLLVALAPSALYAQFAPPAGEPGTTAMHKDSSAFIDWAKTCRVTRGFQDIANPGAGYASTGDSTMAIGIAGTGGVVSLGDGGEAVCTFNATVSNGPGYDFAVFENSFDGLFLELAFVEVSSDGLNFVRFAATSYTQDTVQAHTFDSLDARHLNNLAGKYRAMYGTPFDLNELDGTPGLDVNNITHIKIIDVVGSIDKAYATYDQYGHVVNDPWPTEFPQSGFDLDGIGIINNHVNGMAEAGNNYLPLKLYPNPCTDAITVSASGEMYVRSMSGQLLLQANIEAGEAVSVAQLESGLYMVEVIAGDVKLVQKLMKY